MHKKTVVITGASSGIGKALAEEYAAKGWNLVLAARREELLSEIKGKLKNTEILTVKTDVTVESDCEHLIEKAIENSKN